MQKELLLYQKQHDLYVKRVYPVFLKALQKQIQPVINWIESTENLSPSLDAILDVTVFRRPMIQAYELIGITAAKREYYNQRGLEGKAPISFLINKWRALFDDYALNYAYRIENELTETTREEIRKALAYSYEQGWNAGRTITYLKRSVQGQISRQRAVLIARTETTTASNLGKEQGARSWAAEIGQGLYKEWLGRNDGRERPQHTALNGTFLPVDEDWSVGGEPAKMPGDTRLPASMRIQCRCTQSFITERRYLRMLSAKQ